MDIQATSLDTPSKDMHVKAEDSGSNAKERSTSPERHNSAQLPSTDSIQDAGRSPVQSEPPSGATKKDHKVGVTATSCANCGTTTTPLWRRAANGQTICNACGLYFKARNLTRPPWLKRNVANKKGEGSEDAGDLSDERSASVNGESSTEAGAAKASTAGPKEHVHDSECAGTCPGDGNCNGEGGAESCAGCPSFNQHHTNRQNLVCANCRTITTPLWRRDTSGNTICNACGLYFKLHNVHRPVTMKRAVIKRRKRVHVATNSPPPTDQEGAQSSPANQQSQSTQKTKQKSQKSKQASHSPLPPTGSDLEPSDNDVQVEHTSTKRKRSQSISGPRAVPAIEDYITPTRVNGQDEWSRKGQSTPDGHRRASPMDHTSSRPDREDHGSDMGHREDHQYGSPRQRSSYMSRSQDQHGSSGDYPSQPPRFHFNLHQSHGQYQPVQSMSMSMSSRYSAYPPRGLHSPPDHQHTLPPPHSHNQPSRSQHHYDPDDQHPHGITMQGYQGPRPSDMDDDMHSPHMPSHSSGWNQRLPGYATVSSSSLNTRLSSTGVVRSSGLNPSSPPPHYQSRTSESPADSYSRYRSSASPLGDYHRGESPQSSLGPSRSPPMTNGHTRYSDTRSTSPGGFSGSYHHHHHHHHHHQLPSIRSPPQGDSGDHSMNGVGESTQLPPISLPSPHSGHQRQALPSASELLQQRSHHHHHYPQHSRRLSPPPTLPPSSSLVHSGQRTDNEVLQKTRQDLQREMSHLSMLLGRAAAVLNGLDQALGPNGTGDGTEAAGMPTDPKTHSALASLIALSTSGGDRGHASGASAPSVTGPASPSNGPTAAAAASPATDEYSNGPSCKAEDHRMYSPPPPPPSSTSSHRHLQAMPYPLPRHN